jgi:hypothetical protein
MAYWGEFKALASVESMKDEKNSALETAKSLDSKASDHE